MPSITVNGVTYELPPDDSQASKVPEYNAALIALAAEAVGTNIKKARVYHSATQSLTNATQTPLNFNSERFDTDTMHDTSTNNERLTCKTAGLYLIIANVGFASNVTGLRSLSLELNGALPYIAARNMSSPGLARLQVVTMYQLAVNDYVRVVAFQDSGGALNTEQAGNYSPEFSMIRLGA